MTPAPAPRRSLVPWILIPLGFIVLAVSAFLAIWQFLAPVERHVVVPYSEFVAAAHKGDVDEVRIDGKEIRFRVHVGDRTVVKETVAPSAAQAMQDAMSPNEKMTPPKLVFEK